MTFAKLITLHCRLSRCHLTVPANKNVEMQTWHGAIQPSWAICVGQPQLVLLLVLAVLLGAAGALRGREVLPHRSLSLFHLLCAWLGLAELQQQRHQKVGTKLV